MALHRFSIQRLIIVCLFLIPAISAAGTIVFAQQVRFRQVEREIIEKRLKAFKTGNGKREVQLKSLFAAAGCAEPDLSEQKVQHANNPNVICKLSGTGEHAILVGAHFDLAPVGSGVADNWSGTSLLPSLFESLASEMRKHCFIFVGFTDEEKGLVGSRYYAKHMTENDRQHLHAVINLDTLGLSSTKVWHSHSDPHLMKILAGVAAFMRLPVAMVDVDAVGTSDSESFAPLKIPRLTVHSVTQSTLPILHSPYDNLRAIQLEDYYQTYLLLAGFLAYLDSCLELETSPDAASPGFPSDRELLSPVPPKKSGKR
jgi:hypothetical protein